MNWKVKIYQSITYPVVQQYLQTQKYRNPVWNNLAGKGTFTLHYLYHHKEIKAHEKRQSSLPLCQLLQRWGTLEQCGKPSSAHVELLFAQQGRDLGRGEHEEAGCCGKTDRWLCKAFFGHPQVRWHLKNHSSCNCHQAYFNTVLLLPKAEKYR